MPFLKLASFKEPASYPIHPTITYRPVPFARCHRRQPLKNLALLVRHRDLVGIPHIITILHITNVLVYGNGRLLVCCRTHLALHIAIFVAIGGGGGESGAFRRSRGGVTRSGRRLFQAGLGKGDEGEFQCQSSSNRKVDNLQNKTQLASRTIGVYLSTIWQLKAFTLNETLGYNILKLTARLPTCRTPIGLFPGARHCKCLCMIFNASSGLSLSCQ